MHEIVYRIDKTEGPDHDKTFYVEVSAGGRAAQAEYRCKPLDHRPLKT